VSKEWSVMKNSRPFPEKNNFCSQIWVPFDAVFNRQKTRTYVATRILRFNQSRNESYKNSAAKLSKNHGQTKGGRSHHRPLNTPWMA